MNRRTVGPYGEVSNKTLADNHYIKVTNNFHFGFKTTGNNTLAIDFKSTCNQLFNFVAGSGEMIISDNLTEDIRNNSIGVTNAPYRCFNENRVRPLGWVAPITPYRLYQIQGFKVSYSVPCLQNMTTWNIPTEPEALSDVFTVGLIADEELAAIDWYSYNPNVMGIDPDNWAIFKQHHRTTVYPQRATRGFKTSLYVSLPKYYQLSPQEYNNNPAQFAGSITYDPDTNDVTTVTQPAATPTLHFAFWRMFNMYDGQTPQNNQVSFTGTFKVTYYIRLANPDPVVAVFHPGTGKGR